MKPKSLIAGWLVDGSGEPVRENVLLTIENGTITHIAEAIPEKIHNQEIIDFSHCSLLPGLIDAHIHLFMSGTEDLDIREKQLRLSFEDIIGGMEERLGDLTACGIVACRDAGDRHAYTMQYKRDHLDGNVFPIQLKVAGAAWHQHGRYGKMIGKSPGSSKKLAQSISNQIRCIDHIKIVNSGLNSLVCFGKETPPQFDVMELKGAVAMGKHFGCKTMVHANGKKAVEGALKAGCHSIEHGFFMGEENLERMAEKQIFWVPTAVTMKAYRDAFERRIRNPASRNHSADPSILRVSEMAQGASRNLEHQLEQIRRAKELGVPIALGTDAGSIGVHHGRSLKEEIRLFMTAGFSVPGAVQCATLNNARLLNIDGYGVIAQGAPATFIVATGSPQDLPDSLDSLKSLYIEGKEIRQKKTQNDKACHDRYQRLKS